MRKRFALALVALAASLGATLVSATPAYASGNSGADYSWYRPSDAELSGANVSFVSRYLVPKSFGNGKALTAAEASHLRSRGVVILLNFELATAGASGGYSSGVRDAARAELARVEVGAPANLPIYFSVDFDATDTLNPVLDYLAGAASVLGKPRVGVYGGYATVNAAFNAGYVYGWQTYAWSRGKWDLRAQVRQTANGVLFRGQGDRDIATIDAFGGWGGALTANVVKYGPSGAVNAGFPPGNAGVYDVRRGDTLSSIASHYGTSVRALASVNHIANPNRIYVGERLRLSGGYVPPKVPTTAYYTVRSGDTLGRIASRYGESLRAVESLNRSIRNPNRIYVGQRIRVR